MPTEALILHCARELTRRNYEFCKRVAAQNGQSWEISFARFWEKNRAVACEQAEIVLKAAEGFN